MNHTKLSTLIAMLLMTIPSFAQLTINIRYTGENGGARKYVKEMKESGIAARIRAVEGCLRYDYFFPADDPEGLLLIDEWADQDALNRYHSSPMMEEAAALREKYGLTGRKVTMFNPVGSATWPKGEPNDAYARYFTGQSYLNPLPGGYANVTFEPGCRPPEPSSKSPKASSTGTVRPPTAGCSTSPCTRTCSPARRTSGWSPCPTSSTRAYDKGKVGGWLSLRDDYIHPLDFDLLPHMLLGVWLLRQIGIQPAPVVEIHDEHGSFHLAGLIQQSAGADDMAAQPCHTFQVAWTDRHPLLQHAFTVIGFDNKLHNRINDQ